MKDGGRTTELVAVNVTPDADCALSIEAVEANNSDPIEIQERILSPWGQVD
jgi:hypothetical protein